jgi:hypothetical protein
MGFSPGASLLSTTDCPADDDQITVCSLCCRKGTLFFTVHSLCAIHVYVRFMWCGDFAMSGASWKQLEHLVNRLIKLKGIVLILIVAVAIGLIVCAALALVGLPCPNAYRT